VISKRHLTWFTNCHCGTLLGDMAYHNDTSLKVYLNSNCSSLYKVQTDSGHVPYYCRCPTRIDRKLAKLRLRKTTLTCHRELSLSCRKKAD